MADLFCPDEEFTPADKLNAVQRELGYRKRVYGRLVHEGKMKRETATREIQVFESIADDYWKKVNG
jgi:hypothetical protein